MAKLTIPETGTFITSLDMSQLDMTLGYYITRVTSSKIDFNIFLGDLDIRGSGFQYDGTQLTAGHASSLKITDFLASVKFTNLKLNYADLNGVLFAETAEESSSILFGQSDQLTGGALGDYLMSYGGNDRLSGRGGKDTLDGGAGRDNLDGGAKKDVLIGGTGSDNLSGGADGDVFKFLAVEESRASGGVDKIRDFAHGMDRIHLGTIDADSVLDGNQSFHFIGSGAFRGNAGELRVVSKGDHKVVTADIDGDRHADFQINVYGGDSLTAKDFIL